jgi:SAM-dependent methyltransferase
MNPYEQTIGTWDKIAQVYEDKFMDLDLYNDTYRYFCAQVLTQDARVLEVGCGPGNVTKHLLALRPDFNVYATDVAPNMVALAQKNNPKAVCAVLDARSINTLSPGFDGVVSGFCLPYLSEADASIFIENCAHLLLPKGVLYLSFVAGESSQSGYLTNSQGDSMFFNYHSLADIQRYLSDNSFETKTVFDITYEKQSGTEIHTVLIAQKIF